ncbi:MAG: MazG nucleotide pyrophosphohydrolase domain-containing protein, partial [SAR202 cluster bacterium]|nr:MazG nucleotide pyrophosphohydrolase domain-containing protein [SAR202 cluster bacterium]
ELSEFEAATNCDQQEEEVGDLLFTVANMARHNGIDPEQALRNSNRKFVSRFTNMEKLSEQAGQKFSDLPLKSQDDLWHQVKLEEREP